MIKSPLRRLVVPLSIMAMMLASDVAEAGPFENFFRDIRRAFTHPERKTQWEKKNRKRNTGTASNKKTGSGNPSRAVAGPPDSKNTRSAKRVITTKENNGRLRYGTPVPGKQGFVTSPFSPDSGYIDVRGFQPGTQVKDPYSGKTFLTP